MLDGYLAHYAKRGRAPPNFGPRLLWQNGCMALAMEVGLGLWNIVFDVDQLPPEKQAHPPHQFLAHVYCGHMAGWMKTPLGTEADLSPGHIVLDGVPAPAKRAQQPSFRPMSIVAMVAHLSYC